MDLPLALQDKTKTHIWTNLVNSKYLTLKKLLRSEHAVIFQQISSELKTDNPRQILFHAEVEHNIIPSCYCGKPRKWHNNVRDYRPYCSGSCATRKAAEKQKIKCQELYGVDHHSQLPGFNEKVKATNRKKFGADYYASTAECKTRTAETNLEKYGCVSPALNPDIAAKIAATNLAKFGHAHPWANTEVRKNIAETMFARYGAKHAQQNKEVQQQTKQTCLARYGVEHVGQVPEFQTKLIAARRKKQYTPETFKLLDDFTWLQEQNKHGLTIGDIAKTLGILPGQLNKRFHRYGLTIFRHYLSSIERQLSEHYGSLGILVETRDRKIIAPKEIDIYFPDFKLGVEVNGSYYHSERFQKDKLYHLKKTEAAQEAGIQLLHFWDWELRDSWSKVLAKINSHLGLGDKVFARQLYVEALDSKSKREFMMANHLQGDCRSSVNIGLVDSAGIIQMAATFGRRRANTKYNWELLSSRKNAVVCFSSTDELRILTSFELLLYIFRPV